MFHSQSDFGIDLRHELINMVTEKAFDLFCKRLSKLVRLKINQDHVDRLEELDFSDLVENLA